jgi:hypothetical protein
MQFNTVAQLIVPEVMGKIPLWPKLLILKTMKKYLWKAPKTIRLTRKDMLLDY